MSLIPRDGWDHNIGDLFSALAASLGSREQSQGLCVDDLGMTIPVRSGRVGLVAAIKALGLRPGARIGVPLFCCPIVFHAITAAGCTVHFIDIDRDTYCLSLDDLFAKQSEFDALLAVHMFGNLCDMEKIEEGFSGRLIIEDCAQALGSKQNGRPAGTFGTISFFSFRSGKYISAGEGGALYSKDLAVLDRASRIIERMPSPSPASASVHAASAYLKSILRSRPLYGLIGYWLWRFYNQEVSRSESQSIVLGRISLADLRTIRARLPSLASRVDRQRANAAYFEHTLQLDPGMLCTEKPGMTYNRYLYPIKFPSTKTRDIVAASLFRKRIDSIKYLDGIAGITAKEFGYTGDCPVTEEVSRRVLTIPCYHGLKKKDLQRIAESVNSAWAEVTRTGPI
jgi:perosamine synthetase